MAIANTAGDNWGPKPAWPYGSLFKDLLCTSRLSPARFAHNRELPARTLVMPDDELQISEQLVLLGQRAIDRGLHGLDFTLRVA
jgi:hypothetical protein